MKTIHIALVGVMAAVMCILGPLAIPIGPVPISLTNFVIYIALYALGWKKGTLSYLIYILIGLAGLPVFSGFAGGIGKVAGPTGGYIVGFILMSVIAGYVIEKYTANTVKGVVLCFLAMLGGTVVCYAFGTIWYVQIAMENHSLASYYAAMSVCVFPFFIGDLIKMAAALLLGPQIRKSLAKAQR